MGRLHHAIATKNADAQRFFDQGLTLRLRLQPRRSHPFVSSRRGARPVVADAALGHRAGAWTEHQPRRRSGAREARYDEAQKAKALLGGAPANERAYVEALVETVFKRSEGGSESAGGAIQGRDAQADRAQYPDDLDAATLYAESLMDLNPWQLWSPAGKPAEGTEEIVSRPRDVLRRDRQHVGANHYYIHAVEASKTPERALPEREAPRHAACRRRAIWSTCRRTSTCAPAITSLSRLEQCQGSGSRSRLSSPPTNQPASTRRCYYNHNLDFLASAAMMAGQFATAKKAADELVTNVTPALAEMAMLEPFAAKTLFVLLRFARWDDVLRLPAADAKFPLLVTLSHFGRGIAHAARGNLAEAERERGAYSMRERRIKPESDWGFNKAKSMLEVTDAVLDAWIARARRDDAAAIDAWRIAVITEDMLNYNEPARLVLSVARVARRRAAARQAFPGSRAGPSATISPAIPKNGRSLYGLWQTMLASPEGAGTTGRRGGRKTVPRRLEARGRDVEHRRNVTTAFHEGSMPHERPRYQCDRRSRAHDQIREARTDLRRRRDERDPAYVHRPGRRADARRAAGVRCCAAPAAVPSFRLSSPLRHRPAVVRLEQRLQQKRQIPEERLLGAQPPVVRDCRRQAPSCSNVQTPRPSKPPLATSVKPCG